MRRGKKQTHPRPALDSGYVFFTPSPPRLRVGVGKTRTGRGGRSGLGWGGLKMPSLNASMFHPFSPCSLSLHGATK